MTRAAAIEKYGAKIRWLHDNEDDNDAWSGAYLGPDGPVWPEQIMEPERKD